MKAHYGIILLILILYFHAGLFADDAKQHDSQAATQIALASAYHGMFQNQTLYAVQTDGPARDYAARYKSPGTATMLAVFPGILFHGWGHFYAGDGITGIILLGTEIVSTAIIIHIAAGDSMGHWSMDSKFGLRHALYATGFIGFFGSWIYDIIHADAAARKHNKQLELQVSIPDYNNQAFCISLNLKF